MWRDCWFAVGEIGAALVCLACVLALAWVGRAWAGHVDVLLLPELALFIVVAVHRPRVACWGTR
jgi:hypothetical protein